MSHPARGFVADVDRLARTAESDPDAAGALLCATLIERPAPPRDWPDLLAAQLRDDPGIRLDLWAQAHGLAAETVSRGFRQVFGVAASAFRAEARARRAFEEIVLGRAPLADIAAAAGFADQPHMSRAIKALTGATPGAWRRPSIAFKTPGARPI